MKIKRFIAPNMREAMRLVREDQGDEAVILSNRRVDNGIEVVAATDYDAALVQHAALREPALSDAGRPAATPTPAAPQVNAAPPPLPTTLPVPRESRFERSPVASVMPPPGLELAALRTEMLGLRKLIEQQMAGQAWGELKARNPVRAEVVRRLVGCGIELRLARELAAELPDSATPERARFLPMALLSRRVPAYKTEWLDAGGVVSLVGATGVGKTTTIAKLAARYVQSWGLRDVALVTCDHFRIGAQEQLFTYGRLLGVPVFTADHHAELCAVLDKLRDRKLVLVDTAGISPRDENLARQFAMLSGLPVPNRTALVLSASSQGADLDDQYRRFAPAEPGAVILTKLDEASRLGGALSCVVRHGLPLAYTTDGQRVPEDLAPARPDQLVLRASRSLTRDVEADDESMTLQFAGAVNA